MNTSTTIVFLCLIAFSTARDVGQASPVEPDVKPAAVAPIVVEVEDPSMIGEVIAEDIINDTINLDDVDVDDLSIEVSDEKGNPINTRSKRSIGPIGAIVVKLILKGKIIAHYVFKIVSGFKTGILHGLIG